MNAMPSKLHSGSIFVCMRVCQSILHATLVRFFELLGWVGSVRFGRWFSFARSLARSFSRRLRRGSKKQSRKHALMHASSCFFSCFFSSFLLPRFRRDFKHAFSHFSVSDIRVKATSSSALTTTRRCTQGCAAVIRALRSSSFQRGGLARRKSGSDGMIRDCGVWRTGSDFWA